MERQFRHEECCDEIQRKTAGDSVIERCQKWLDAKEYNKARAEYAALASTLPEPDRDQAKVGIGAADFLAGDAAGFWDLVRENRDDLKWCGASPLYTFLKVMPRLKSELLHYQQWQIDPHSAVTFGALRFEESPG